MVPRYVIKDWFNFEVNEDFFKSCFLWLWSTGENQVPFVIKIAENKSRIWIMGGLLVHVHWESQLQLKHYVLSGQDNYSEHYFS